jgi:plastocyanin
MQYRMARTGWWLAVAIAAIAIGGGWIAPAPPAPVQAATSFQAAVGAQSSDESIQVNQFFPRELAINVGDTITWTFPTAEIHTVTFLSGAPRPPFTAPPSGGPTYDGTGIANSGVRTNADPPYTLTFTQTGNFQFECLVHPLQTGVVQVRPAGTPYPRSPAGVTAQGALESAPLLLRGAGLLFQGVRQALATPNQVTAGTGQLLPHGSLAIMRFLPDTRAVRAGQTVTWTNRDPETPHTVTFGPPPANPVPPSGNVMGGAATISAVGQAVHSGFLGASPPSVGTQFRVTFTTPGTYPYICVLHADLGMRGTIIVTP